MKYSSCKPFHKGDCTRPKPPLCKGRCRFSGGGVVKNNPSDSACAEPAPFAQGSLFGVEPPLCGSCCAILGVVAQYFYRKPPLPCEGEVAAKLTEGLERRQSPCRLRRHPPLHKGAHMKPKPPLCGSCCATPGVVPQFFYKSLPFLVKGRWQRS